MDENTIKHITIADFLKEGMPSLLCSGCWPLDDLEEYLARSREKEQAEQKETPPPRAGR
jgi:hypothetical protein